VDRAQPAEQLFGTRLDPRAVVDCGLTEAQPVHAVGERSPALAARGIRISGVPIGGNWGVLHENARYEGVAVTSDAI
jgi:hypothetical protein